ncbi:MAG: phosphoribosylamine--glycine ligase [Hyphomonadaceae bacterium]|nr:MAG: phosphoribosylamine--glycine ligase [Hyphomonadaceae bacterium]
MVVGGGGREHALVWKLASCPNVTHIIAAPGNPGIASIAKIFDIAADDILGLVNLAKCEKIDLVVIGPEVALALGLADKLRAIGIATFGPSKAAAQLESSKAFAKDFMARHNIPTAKYGVFEEYEPAIAFLKALSPPYVLKASGLAAGKGVVIAPDFETAQTEVKEMLSGKFGDASKELVIEEFMQGEEASFFVLCNQQSAIPLPICQDHKRAFDNDLGPNTGGMGAFAPTSLVDEKLEKDIISKIIEPTLRGLKDDKIPFNGVLYVGLMIENGQARVVEYNCRFGDPECQILMQFIGDDFAQCLMDIATEKPAKLAQWPQSKSSVTIVLAANGYPGEYIKNGEIFGIGAAESGGNAKVFHSGTKLCDDGGLCANGGRVLNVTASASNLKLAIDQAYKAIEKINAPSLFYRTDIGAKELKRTPN